MVDHLIYRNIKTKSDINHYKPIYSQWEFQDPKMEVRFRTISLAIEFGGISPEP